MRRRGRRSRLCKVWRLSSHNQRRSRNHRNIYICPLIKRWGCSKRRKRPSASRGRRRGRASWLRREWQLRVRQGWKRDILMLSWNYLNCFWSCIHQRGSINKWAILPGRRRRRRIMGGRPRERGLWRRREWRRRHISGTKRIQPPTKHMLRRRRRQRGRRQGRSRRHRPGHAPVRRRVPQHVRRGGRGGVPHQRDGGNRHVQRAHLHHRRREHVHPRPRHVRGRPAGRGGRWRRVQLGRGRRRGSGDSLLTVFHARWNLHGYRRRRGGGRCQLQQRSRRRRRQHHSKLGVDRAVQGGRRWKGIRRQLGRREWRLWWWWRGGLSDK